MANGEDEMKKAGKRVAGKQREKISSRKGSAQHKERQGKANTETKARTRKAPFVL